MSRVLGADRGRCRPSGRRSGSIAGSAPTLAFWLLAPRTALRHTNSLRSLSWKPPKQDPGFGQLDHDQIRPLATVYSRQTFHLRGLVGSERSERIGLWIGHGLDLHGDHDPVMTGHDVEFAAADANISGNDDESVTNQKSARQ